MRRLRTIVRAGAPSGGRTRPAIVTFPLRLWIDVRIIRRRSFSDSERSLPTLA